MDYRFINAMPLLYLFVALALHVLARHFSRPALRRLIWGFALALAVAGSVNGYGLEEVALARQLAALPDAGDLQVIGLETTARFVLLERAWGNGDLRLALERAPRTSLARAIDDGVREHLARARRKSGPLRMAVRDEGPLSRSVKLILQRRFQTDAKRLVLSLADGNTASYTVHEVLPLADSS